MTHTLAIKAITPLAHNVFQYTLEKPEDFTFTPGQATEVCVNKPDWKDEARPFTFTSLPDWDDLQFTIKSYPDHDGVTEKLSQLLVGDELMFDEPWGTIEYKGPGTFIAGGAGITPFLSILRDLERKNELAGHTLYFANRRERDIFNEVELGNMPGLEVHHVLSQEEKTPYQHGRIDKDFLERHIDDFSQKFYVCGPDKMVEDINGALKELGAEPDGLVFEE